MSCFLSPAQREARARNDLIKNAIRQTKKQIKKEIKLLLLGTPAPRRTCCACTRAVPALRLPTWPLGGAESHTTRSTFRRHPRRRLPVQIIFRIIITDSRGSAAASTLRARPRCRRHVYDWPQARASRARARS